MVQLTRKLKPISSSTFGEYIDTEFKTNILARFVHADRSDLVFDHCRTGSIKNATRDGRGDGKRRKIDPSAKIRSISENETELFFLISEQLLDST